MFQDEIEDWSRIGDSGVGSASERTGLSEDREIVKLSVLERAKRLQVFTFLFQYNVCVYNILRVDKLQYTNLELSEGCSIVLYRSLLWILQSFIYYINIDWLKTLLILTENSYTSDKSVLKLAIYFFCDYSYDPTSNDQYRIYTIWWYWDYPSMYKI